MNYIIKSFSIKITDEEIKKIVKNNNIINYDLSIDDFNNCLEEASYCSLFDDEKYLIIKNANIFTPKNKYMDNLVKYLKDPNPNTTIIFLVDSYDKRVEATKLINQNNGIIDIAKLKVSDLQKLVVEQFTKDKFKISTDLAYYILNQSLNNYDIACQEIEKIKLYYDEPCMVNKEDVENLISKSLEDNTFKFTSAVLEKDLRKALEVLKDLKAQKIDSNIIFITLSNEYRNIAITKYILEKGKNTDVAHYFNKLDWQVASMINNSYKYKTKELDDIILSLANFNKQIRYNKITTEQALNLFLMNI